MYLFNFFGVKFFAKFNNKIISRIFTRKKKSNFFVENVEFSADKKHWILPIKLKLRLELSIATNAGPILMIGQSETVNSSQIISIRLFFGRWKACHAQKNREPN